MARESFKSTNFSVDSLTRLVVCNQIIIQYLKMGLRLTLRQLFYQLVTKNIIPNTDREYGSLGRLISLARLAGLVDWEAIEDRIRVPKSPPEFSSLSELVQAAINSFRLPRWKGQQYYCELWVEKDALAGVLEPLALRYHVVLMVNRGYSSQSAMYAASKRFLAAEEAGQTPLLYYLGDHDPSGEDMVRDIRERLLMFGVDVKVTKLALTTQQVITYKPPPNPTKMTDSRAEGYIAKFGRRCWEVDALPPNVLIQLITDAFVDTIDKKALDKVLQQEKVDIARLKKLLTK